MDYKISYLSGDTSCVKLGCIKVSIKYYSPSKGTDTVYEIHKFENESGYIIAPWGKPLGMIETKQRAIQMILDRQKAIQEELNSKQLSLGV